MSDRVEWRLTFTLWGGLVLLANAITDIKELTKVDTRWILVGVATTTLLHFGWEYFFVVRAAKLNRLQRLYSNLTGLEFPLEVTA